jgi:hypothetical protein
MNTFTTPRRDDHHLDPYSDEATGQRPRRRRRQLLTWRSAALGAVAACAVGVYAGIRLEKGQLAGSGTTAASTAGTGRGGAGSRGGLAALFSGASRGRGLASGGAGGGAAGNASFGTVTSLSGKTLYVTGASGNTVKVKLSGATKISKTQSAPRSAIHPGDTVVVQGVGGPGGTVAAAAVTDSGTRAAGAFGTGGAGGAGGAGSASGGAKGPGGTSSAVGSLFSSGG